MADAAVEVGEQRGSLRSDDGSFPIGAGEGVDGLERLPERGYENLRVSLQVAHENGSSSIPKELAQRRQDNLRKMSEVRL